MDEQIEKLSHTHKYYLVIKKKDILPLTTWLDLKDFMPNKISQTDKKQILYDLSYIWKLKTKTKPKDTEKKLVVARGGGKEIGGVSELYTN